MTADASACQVRCLTPPGSGAIAALEVLGPGAWAVIRSFFRPRAAARELDDQPRAGQLITGRFGPPPGDDVVIAVRRVEPVVVAEVHCHGGTETVRWLLEAISAAGAVVAPQSGDAETDNRELARRALRHATSLRTANILLDQWRGALAREMSAMRQDLLTARLPEAARRVNDLRRWASVGRHLVDPWRVAIAGVPNVGKSSLVNALAGYQRCVVTPVPGTTRDVVAVRLVIDGWPVELLDTAGLRGTDEQLEAAGVERAHQALHKADLCLWVVETTAEPTPPPTDLKDPLLVVNKADLPAVWPADQVPGGLRVSAVTSEGLGDLMQAIANRLVPHAPPPGAAVPFLPEMTGQIEAIDHFLAAGCTAEGISTVDRLRRAPKITTDR